MLQPRTHGDSRGLDQTLQSHFLQGRFGRLFRHLPPAEFGEKAEKTLKNLAEIMVSSSEPKEGPIPAGYTYLGQFIDHDLTFDPVSSLQRDNDPASIVDYRTPRFDLDCVYGRGPADNPYFYRDDGIQMRLGRRLTNGPKGLGYDVPRAGEADPLRRSADDSEKALIGDPRNDENVIIAQLHALFLQFHNRMVHKLQKKTGVAPTFAEVQREVRWHYQWVILYDFLPRVIRADIYQKVLPHVAIETEEKLQPPLIPESTLVQNAPVLKFYEPEEEAYMPVEFSGAAYRFGHSMVRDEYLLNTNQDLGIGGPLAILCNGDTNLRGFRSFRPQWGIEWGYFFEGFDVEPPPQQRPLLAGPPQRAFAIDTSLAKPLRTLPFPSAADIDSLAARNLLRGWRLGLPSGQTLAHALGENELTEDELRVGGKKLSSISHAFRDNAPLWYYILAEASQSKHGTLGPVGSRIVMETFVGLMLEDGHSFLREHPKWKPIARPFGMTQFIKFAQNQ